METFGLENNTTEEHALLQRSGIYHGGPQWTERPDRGGSRYATNVDKAMCIGSIRLIAI